MRSTCDEGSIHPDPPAGADWLVATFTDDFGVQYVGLWSLPRRR